MSIIIEQLETEYPKYVSKTVQSVSFQDGERGTVGSVKCSMVSDVLVYGNSEKEVCENAIKLINLQIEKLEAFKEECRIDRTLYAQKKSK